MIAEYFAKRILHGKVPLLLKFMIKIMALKRNLLLKEYGAFKFYKNIENNHDYYIDKDAFVFSKRKDGISLFARLKNAQDFLECSVISQEPFFDEIVLVDNNSTDATKDICRALAKRYPHKVRFYEYSPDVYSVGHEQWINTSDDSIHSLSYYYNWTLSKTTCKYVAKIDDDIVAYNEKLLKEKTDYIRKYGISYLQILPQINVNLVGGEIKTPIRFPDSRFFPPVAGLYLDHGIFPVSEQTYFIKGKRMETFLFPFGISISSPCFLHLKGMKQDIKNWKGQMKQLVQKQMDESIYVLLPKKYKDIVCKYVPQKIF